jgi:hypothetical protein
MPRASRSVTASAREPSTYTSTSTSPSTTRAPPVTVAEPSAVDAPVWELTGRPLAAAAARNCSPLSSLATTGGEDSGGPAACAGWRPSARRLMLSRDAVASTRVFTG